MVLRVHGEEIMFPSPLHQVSHRIPQMNMMKVHIPFTFKLMESAKSSYSGELFSCFEYKRRPFSLFCWHPFLSMMSCDWPGVT